MRVLFDGEIHVHYRFLDLMQAEDMDPPVDHGATVRGQQNGLLGRQGGALSMVTGLHTGQVPIRVEWHDTTPEPDLLSEEVVEVSFVCAGGPYVVRAFDTAVDVGDLPSRSLRARWLANGMDAGEEVDTRMDGEPAPDRYVLQLWPAPPAPGALLRQTSEAAAYWHRVAARADR